MRIREAKKPEAERITKQLWMPLAKEMEEKSAYNELVEEINMQQSINHRKEGIREPDKFTYIAESDELQGFISAKVKDTPPIFTRGDKMKINELYVKPSHRRKGIATKLIENIRKVAEKEKCDTLELSLDVGNKEARKMYNENGFKAVREKMVQHL